LRKIPSDVAEIGETWFNLFVKESNQRKNEDTINTLFAKNKYQFSN
jgi:hypothetical protein